MNAPNVTIDGTSLYFRPTFFPSHDVREWGGRWDAKRKAWKLAILTANLDKIRAYDASATLSADVERWAAFDYDSPGEIASDAHVNASKLYPYQREAVKRLVQSKMHGQMLALSPGLGKTPTSIVAADLLREHDTSRVLVVAPLSLLNNWSREIERWSDTPEVDLCHGQNPSEHAAWVVTNYDTIRLRLDAYADVKWDVIICDESVLLKNRKAQRTQRIKTLATMAANKVVMLSGAPVVRDNSDIWAQFNIIQPEYFTSYWRFTQDTCVVAPSDWGVQILGSRANVDLSRDYREVMFVRNQERVLPDLPEVRYQDVEVVLSQKQRKMHDDLLDTWVAELEANPDHRVEVSIVLAQLTRLQQIVSNLRNCESINDYLEARGFKRPDAWPDVSAKADVIVELLSDGEVELPCLIWGHWRYGMQSLHARLERETTKKDSALYGKRVALVLGATKDRDEIIESYKRGEIDVLIMSLGVGKYGHTLTSTRTIIYHDKTWDSDAYFQSLHRVRRNGLSHSPHCISLRARNTIDEFVELNLAGKLPSMAKTTGAALAKLLRSLGEDRVTP